MIISHPSSRPTPRLAAAAAAALVVALAAAAPSAAAQATPVAPTPTRGEARPQEGQAAMKHEGMMRGGVWPAMDQYHLTLMRAWHAANQANDLAPARAAAPTLVKHANAWAASEVPAACGGADTGGEVAAVASESRKVASMVEAKAADSELKAALAALHERFEKVMGSCSAPSSP